MAKVQAQVTNCFAPIPAENLAPQLDPIQYETTREEWVLIPEAKVVDGNPDNVVLIYKPVKKGTIDIQEYIASFADEVGIQNILKKLSLSGDKSLLNQTHREALCPDGGLEPIQDYTNVPSSKAEAFEAVRRGVEAYDNLPEDIKGKMSFAQFAEGFGQADFDAYISKILAANSNVEGGNE